MLVVDLSTHETPHAPLEYEDFSDRPDDLRKEVSARPGPRHRHQIRALRHTMCRATHPAPPLTPPPPPIRQPRRMIFPQPRLIANCERDEECAVEEVEEINARMRRLKNYLRIEEEDDFTSSLDFAVDPSRIEATEAEQLALAKAERKRSEVEAATRFLNILVEHRKAAVAMAWDDRRYAKRGALGYAPMGDLQA